MESRRKLNLGEQNRLNVSDRETKLRRSGERNVLKKFSLNEKLNEIVNEHKDATKTETQISFRSEMRSCWLCLANGSRSEPLRIIFQWWNWLRKISSMFHVELKYQIALDRLPMTHANRKHLVLCLLCERWRSLHENFAISEKISVALNQQQQQRLAVYSTPTAQIWFGL